MKRVAPWLLAVVVVALVSGCSSSARTSTAASSPSSVQVPVLPKGAVTENSVSSSTSGCPAATDSALDAQARAMEDGPTPAPGEMPSGTYLATIQQRGYLTVGVDQNTLFWAYRNSDASDPEGFDIDVLRQVEKAIFGDTSDQHIKFVVVPNNDRIADVQSGSVDLVAETMTINAARKLCVDFSSSYYTARQKLLVPIGSPIRSFSDLAGRRVCASLGSTSITNIGSLGLQPPPQIWGVANQTDCLVMLQQGQVDAVSTDDTILDGLAAQDPHLTVLPAVLPRGLGVEPYGIAISKSHPELTWFVDRVLSKARATGTLTAISERWLGSHAENGGTSQ